MWEHRVIVRDAMKLRQANIVWARLLTVLVIL